MWERKRNSGHDRKNWLHTATSVNQWDHYAAPVLYTKFVRHAHLFYLACNTWPLFIHCLLLCNVDQSSSLPYCPFIPTWHIYNQIHASQLIILEEKNVPWKRQQASQTSNRTSKSRYSFSSTGVFSDDSFPPNGTGCIKVLDWSLRMSSSLNVSKYVLFNNLSR